jgi:hypothetical protein
LRRQGLWQRVLDRLAEPNTQHNYDGFAAIEDAEAAVTALSEVDIPARATMTDSGPVLLVAGRFRRRADPLIRPFQAEP